MNIELIKKLIKLANNNPNEHEANLAARKACHLIEEGKFDFGMNKKEPGQTKKPEPNRSNSSIVYEDLLKTYQDMFRERGFRSHWRDEPFAWERDFREPYGYKPSWEKSEPERERQQKPKKILECKTCGFRKETTFRGLESIYICNECLWESFNKGRV